MLEDKVALVINAVCVCVCVAYQKICDDSRNGQRSQEVINSTSDEDGGGELHCQKRKGLSQGIFGLPDSMFSSDIHDKTRFI